MVKKHEFQGWGRLRCDRGAGEFIVLMLLTAMVAMAGLVYDAGMAFNAERRANNIAANAARVGANQLDLDRLYGEGVVWLDIDHAVAHAQQSARRAGAETVQPSYDVDARELTITVEITHTPKLLGIIGVDPMTMSGEGTARVQRGSAP